MRFYFPDSQDQVDPNFDFRREEHLPHHVRQRDDRYAHEMLAEPAHDGLLVSMAAVIGMKGVPGRYSSGQRRRLLDYGVHRFFRLDEAVKPMDALGDCGAFAYVDDDEPPISVEDAIDFYEECRFDAGISVDHLVPAFQSERTPRLLISPELETEIEQWERRIEITLTNADAFLQRHRARKCRFEPVASAQGWSPSSYARSVQDLQKMGYRRIALGGMVPMKTDQIIESLEAIHDVRRPDTSLHLLGVTRTRELETFQELGVASFDSTSPFRQSFMDATDNYYSWDGDHYVAVRVPPTESNARLQARIRAGQVDHDAARLGERECLRLLRAYGDHEVEVMPVLEALRDYHRLVGEPDRKTGVLKDRTDEYARTLSDRPWEACTCGVCAEAGIEVVLFRGTERNKRRGFHNLAVFAADLRDRIAASSYDATRTG